MKSRNRNICFVAVIIIFVSFILTVLALNSTGANTKQVSLTKVFNQVNDGKIEELMVDGNKITAVPKEEDKPELIAYREDPSVSMKEYGFDLDKVVLTAEGSTDSNSFLEFMLIVLLPIALPIAVLVGFFLWLAAMIYFILK